jgi:ubiquinone/menaquinone biosynthesis C-methylase UbiE
MSTVQADTDTTEFIDFWNRVLVPKFIKYRHILVGGLTRHSAEVFPELEVGEGDRVVDIACGFGDTALLLSERVGPAGSVLGLDCCDAFLEYAREDAAAQGAGNVTFIEGDAQRFAFEPVHDFCFSRFGTQFFENPVAGLRNMRSSLKPGGVMTSIVWRALAENPWLALPKEIVLRHLPSPGEDADTCGPGPFSMADPEMVTKQFEIAGYTDIHFKRVDAPVMIGNSLDEAVEFQIALGPAGEIFREAGDEAEQKRDSIVAALKSELKAFETSDGILLDSSSWVISARNPG